MGATTSFTASARQAWVVNQLFAHNHQFAATNAADLAFKMGKMEKDIFIFFRGTAHIFFQDMSTLPASRYISEHTGYTWLNGDAHLANFGAMRDSSGTQVFAVSDFDEGYLGQYVWDLRRLAVSLLLAGRDQGIAADAAANAVNSLADAYIGKMEEFKGSGKELSFQLTQNNTSGAVQDTIEAGAAGSRKKLLSKFTLLDAHTRVFKTSDKLQPVSADTHEALVASMRDYIASIAPAKRYPAGYYEVKDVCQRFRSGVGSLGKLRYYLLLAGDAVFESDNVIIELKQAIPSAVAAISDDRLPPSSYRCNEGCRVAKTLKAQLIHADVLAGHTNADGIDYFVREKSPWDNDFDPASLSSADKLENAASYLGIALASAHALADQDYDGGGASYSIDKHVTEAITSKSGFKSELADFAVSYTAQVELDWNDFKAAYAAGMPLY
jgi:uncharacterized protein (DUF2252 family)